MASVTIRPDGILSSLGLTSGTLANVNDGSDGTFMLWTGGGNVVLGFANPSIPSDAQIKTVRLSYRVQTSSGTSFVTSRLYVTWPSGAYKAFGYGFVATTTIKQFVATALASNPKGNPWLQADVNALAATIFVNPNTRLLDVWVDITYNVAPTVTVTAPTGLVATTIRPTLTWTYADADGNAQERYRAKVFSSAQYSAIGFNPETSTPVWDSGEVVSDAGGAPLPQNLTNLTAYRAYVKVSDAGSNGRYSAWAFSTFSTSVAVPATPTLTIVGNSDLSVTLNVAGLTAGNGVVVERSDDGGVTWPPVRGSYGWLTSAATFTGVDYEAPVNFQTQYRAWQWNTDTSGNVFSSGYSTISTLLLSNARLLLSDPLTPGSVMPISLRDNMKVTSPRFEGVFDPLGSATAVVLVDATPGGDRIALPLQFKTDTAWRAFMALRATGAVLRLLTDTVDQWYVQLTDAPETETQASADRTVRPYRTLDLTGIAVDAPPDLTPAPGS